MSGLVRVLDSGLSRLREACWPVACAGLAMGGYLTLRPSGQMANMWWLPTVIGQWCDQHGQLRNVPAFFLLVIPFLIALRRFPQRFVAMLALGFLAAFVEAMQLVLPGRHSEWEDVVFSWAGLLIAWSLSGSIRFFIRRLRSLAVTLRNRHYGWALDQSS
jgi:hypothetical protein